MNSDIRLSIGFKGHRKRKKLRRLVGDLADSYLIDLWLTVALDRPDGILTGWTADDIADSCGWEGEPQALLDALIDAGWIDIDNDGVMLVHDWEEHQSWACKAKDRSEQARKAAEKRWGAKKGEKETEPEDPGKSEGSEIGNTDVMLTACSPHCGSIAGAYAPFLSLPILSNINNTSNPTSKTESNDINNQTLDDPTGSPDAGDGKRKIIYPEPFLKFWKEYPRKVGKGVALKAYQNIKAPRPSLGQILESVKAHSKMEQWKTKSHIPHPSTFLNERRWEDELTDEDFNPSTQGSSYSQHEPPKSQTINYEYDNEGRPIYED